MTKLMADSHNGYKNDSNEDKILNIHTDSINITPHITSHAAKSGDSADLNNKVTDNIFSVTRKADVIDSTIAL